MAGSSVSALERFALAAESDEIDLAQMAMLIAAAEYPNLDVKEDLRALDSLAAGASHRLPQQRDPLACANALSEYLFDEVGFRGNREDYYDPRNSFLNEVLGRRLGIPITLSLVYIEVGKRLGVPFVGVGMPGHFMVSIRYQQEDLMIDPFNRGFVLSAEECAQRLLEVARGPVPWDRSYLAPVSDRMLIERILRNLSGIYVARHDQHRAQRATEWLLTLQSQSPQE